MCCKGPVFTLTVCGQSRTCPCFSVLTAGDPWRGRGAQLAAQIATSSAAVLDIVTSAGNEGSQ